MSIRTGTGAVAGIVYVDQEDGDALEGLPTPQPTPDLNAYLRERRIRLSRNPKALKNYIAFMKSDRRSVTPNYRPIRLDIENVSRCNFKCSMCVVSEWHKGQRGADLSLADFKKIIDEEYGLLEVKVQGLGEPLLQGNDYFEMIKYARERHIWVRSTTNASLLHLKDNYKKVIDSGVNELQISIDGADAETYSNIRVGGDFQRVKSNCALINAYCKHLGVERTKMWVVVQRSNYHQLSDLVRLAAELGFTSLAFSLNLVDFGVEAWREKNDSVTVEGTLSRSDALDLLELGKQLGVSVAFWSVTSKYNSRTPNAVCPWPFERAYISSDMRVVPCCIIGNPEVSDLGDAQEFDKVWTNEAMEQFRRDHLEGRIPTECRSCYESDGD
mgnify:CR=1 FL=1